VPGAVTVTSLAPLGTPLVDRGESPWRGERDAAITVGASVWRLLIRPEDGSAAVEGDRRALRASGESAGSGGPPQGVHSVPPPSSALREARVNPAARRPPRRSPRPPSPRSSRAPGPAERPGRGGTRRQHPAGASASPFPGLLAAGGLQLSGSRVQPWSPGGSSLGEGARTATPRRTEPGYVPPTSRDRPDSP